LRLARRETWRLEPRTTAGARYKSPALRTGCRRLLCNWPPSRPPVALLTTSSWPPLTSHRVGALLPKAECQSLGPKLAPNFGNQMGPQLCIVYCVYCVLCVVCCVLYVMCYVSHSADSAGCRVAPLELPSWVEECARGWRQNSTLLQPMGPTGKHWQQLSLSRAGRVHVSGVAKGAHWSHTKRRYVSLCNSTNGSSCR